MPSNHPSTRTHTSPPLAPRVVVVTGASSGIGQAIALEFARNNCAVIVHGRNNLVGLSHTAEMCNSPLAVAADLTKSESIYHLADAAFARFGYVDVWVHAAGADVLTGNAKQWSFETKLQRLLDLDLRAMALLSRTVANRQVQQKSPQKSLPSMIHIGWDQANSGFEGDSGLYFCPVKAAVNAFSKSLAKSYAPNLRVNCLLPGWIQTQWGQHTSPEWNSRAQNESLLGRWGTPEDVAKVAVAISMGDAEFINAQDIPVNGGWHGGPPSVRSNLSMDSIPKRSPFPESP